MKVYEKVKLNFFKILSILMLIFEIVNIILRYNTPNLLYSSEINKCFTSLLKNYYQSLGMFIKFFGIIISLIICIGVFGEKIKLLKASIHLLTIYFLGYNVQLLGIILFNYFLKCNAFTGKFYTHIFFILFLLIIFSLYLYFIFNLKFVVKLFTEERIKKEYNRILNKQKKIEEKYLKGNI